MLKQLCYDGNNCNNIYKDFQNVQGIERLYWVNLVSMQNQVRAEELKTIPMIKQGVEKKR